MDAGGGEGHTGPRGDLCSSLLILQGPHSQATLGELVYSLTILLHDGVVQLQVIQTKAGTGRADHIPQQGPAVPAPTEPHCAVVVLGDDGPSAATLGNRWQGSRGQRQDQPHIPVLSLRTSQGWGKSLYQFG